MILRLIGYLFGIGAVLFLALAAAAAWYISGSVSYTHLTLPTNREV